MNPHAGQLLILGFDGKQAPDELLARISAGRVGGVILFHRNLGTLDEIDALTRQLAAAVPAGDPPLLISLDQEGGRVQRVKAPFPHWPPMARLGAHDDEALSESVGRAMGEELRALGFNVDYAPVLDVHSNPANPIIGDRAFSDDTERAIRHALAFWRGLESAGVRGCGKHFPGHGDTAQDSHLELPTVAHDLARLKEVELAPFARAVAAGVPTFMTAHVVYPAVDKMPATMSHVWLTEVLRQELGFTGVVITDDLDMKAVAANWPVDEVVLRSLSAGADAFLACEVPATQQKVERALADAAEVDPGIAARVAESARRLRAFRATLADGQEHPHWSTLPLDEHAQLAKLVAAKS